MYAQTVEHLQGVNMADLGKECVLTPDPGTGACASGRPGEAGLGSRSMVRCISPEGEEHRTVVDGLGQSLAAG